MESAIVTEKTYDGIADAKMDEVIIDGSENEETWETGKDYRLKGISGDMDATRKNTTMKVTAYCTQK